MSPDQYITTQGARKRHRLEETPTGSSSRPAVLVVGEALVDITERANERALHPGGSPMNVAYGLARLGTSTEFVTQFADDEFGRLIDRHLDAVGVRSRRLGDPSHTASAAARIGSDGSAEYHFDVAWTLPRFDLVFRPELLHVGSIGAVVEPGAASVRQVARDAVASGVLLTYDINARPQIMGPREHVLRRVEGLARIAHVTKMSDEDASWLYPHLSYEEVANHLLRLGSQLVAITLGGEGSFLCTATATLHQTAKRVPVVDTIGAGDAFMSGMLFAALTGRLVRQIALGDIRQQDLEALANYASTSAALTVGRSGAAPPTLGQLETSLP